MYLDGKKDPTIIAMAGVEIGDSPEFKRLAEELNKFMQKSVDHSGQLGADPEGLRGIADKPCTSKQMEALEVRHVQF
jgi:hypothetical protein